MEEKKYPIGGYAPGNYHNRCSTCSRSFFGDKQAVQCESCALASKEKFDALSPEEQFELRKKNAAIANEMFAGKINATPKTYEQGYTEGWDAAMKAYRQPGPVWVKASEFKTSVPVYRPYRRKRNNDNEEPYDYGEIYVTEDNGDIFFDVDNERSFEPQTDECWKDYEILDESGAAAAPQWTPASTKPEHNVGVLVFIPGEDNHITSGMWDIDNKWVLLDEYRTPEEEVAHWMPLPDFPDGYKHDALSDEWVSTLKAIAKEELSNNKGTAAAGREESGQINREWINNALVEFALAYHRSTNKDIANDAAEYLDDKLKEVGVVYVLSVDESQAAGREEDAVEFGKWLKHLDNGTTHYNPFTKEETASIGFSPADCFADDTITVEELYLKFKQQKEK